MARSNVVQLPRKNPSLWRELLGRARLVRRQPLQRPNPFSPAQPLPGVTGDKPRIPKLALDAADAWKGAVDNGGYNGIDPGWMGGYAANYFASSFEEGTSWLGYPLLALMAVRTEYQVMTSTLATEMVREWITIKSKSGDKKLKKRIDQLNERLDELKLKDNIKAANANDGFQGRGQLYIDTGEPDNREELKLPLSDMKAVKAKYGTGKFIQRLGAIEPMWCYPAQYEATDPLKAEWYRPSTWWVMGKEVSRDRLLTFVGHPVSDIIKPAYSFGGLSMTQMAKPYVDFWLRNRTSESDLLNNFSLRILATELDVTTADEGSEILARAQTMSATADNLGIALINKTSEEFHIENAALAGVPEIVKQSMERMTLPSRMPIVKFFGNQPSGLNADSEGVIRMWYDDVKARQESRNREIIQRVIDLCQIELFGDVIDDIEFEFNDLWQLDEAGKSAIQKTKGDQRAVDIEAGIIMPEEARLAAIRDPDSQYQGLDLDEELPQPDPEEMAMMFGEPANEGETAAERGESKPGMRPNRRDFAPGLTSAAGKFGGAVTGGFSAGKGT